MIMIMMKNKMNNNINPQKKMMMMMMMTLPRTTYQYVEFEKTLVTAGARSDARVGTRSESLPSDTMVVESDAIGRF